jgi:hypothetical protein
VTAARWPNLFIVGVPRAGTTSLWHYLGCHPDIFTAAVKEPHFFSARKPRFAPSIGDERRYLSLYRGAGVQRYLCDASAGYLYDPVAAEAIRHRSPQAKIIASLRDPVERAFSAYLGSIRYGERRSFEEAIYQQSSDGSREWSPHVAAGFYSDPLARYIRLFGRESVHALFFEELISDPESELRRVFEFLGVEADLAATIDFKPYNRFARPRNRLAATISSSRRLRRASRLVLPIAARDWIDKRLNVPRQRPAMEPEVRQLLERAYAPERSRLEALLGRELPW